LVAKGRILLSFQNRRFRLTDIAMGSDVRSAAWGPGGVQLILRRMETAIVARYYKRTRRSCPDRPHGICPPGNDYQTLTTVIPAFPPTCLRPFCGKNWPKKKGGDFQSIADNTRCIAFWQIDGVIIIRLATAGGETHNPKKSRVKQPPERRWLAMAAVTRLGLVGGKATRYEKSQRFWMLSPLERCSCIESADYAAFVQKVGLVL